MVQVDYKSARVKLPRKKREIICDFWCVDDVFTRLLYRINLKREKSIKFHRNRTFARAAAHTAFERERENYCH